jgi:signal transduction histidine kinase
VDTAEPHPLKCRTDLAPETDLVRDIHDVVGSAMTAIHLHATSALRTLDHRPAETARALQTIVATSQRSLAEVRSILASASEVDRSEASLTRLDALTALASAGPLEVGVEVVGDPATLSARHDRTAYRIVQESLTNVLRHADASVARVRVSIAADGVGLEISDDGVGDAPQRHADPRDGGLRGIRDRARLLGGDVWVATAPGEGFLVRAVLPISDNQRSED